MRLGVELVIIIVRVHISLITRLSVICDVFVDPVFVSTLLFDSLLTSLFQVSAGIFIHPMTQVQLLETFRSVLFYVKFPLYRAV